MAQTASPSTFDMPWHGDTVLTLTMFNGLQLQEAQTRFMNMPMNSQLTTPSKPCHDLRSVTIFMAPDL